MSAELRWNYVGSFDARTPEQKYIQNVADQGQIAAYQTFDLFFGYDLPWKGHVRVGARNITDRLPTLNRFAFGDIGFSQQLHDVAGRVWVTSYTQTFK